MSRGDVIFLLYKSDMDLQDKSVIFRQSRSDMLPRATWKET